MEFELRPQYTIDDFTDYWKGFAAKPPGKKPPKQSAWAQKLAAGLLIAVGGIMAVTGLTKTGESPLISLIVGVLFAGAGIFYFVRGVPEHPKWAEKAWENYVKQGNASAYRFTEDAIELDSDQSSHRYDYALVQRLWEDEGHYYLFVDQKFCHILCKNSFDKGDPAQFAPFLARKTGKSIQWVDGEDQRPLLPDRR